MADVQARRRVAKSTNQQQQGLDTNPAPTPTTPKPHRDASATHPHRPFLTTTATILSVVLLLCYAEYSLPTPKSESTPPNEYSENRARVHLESIASLGQRVVGSRENEVLAVEYLVHEATQLKNKFPSRNVEVEVYRPSGAFSTDFLFGFTNVYDNVTNVLVYVPGTGPNEFQRTVLLNAHFDSALGTPAASDDVVMIASMLEVLSNVLHSEPTYHGIVFNFNGAEETNWMAAHGFITQHKWRHAIRVMINMEGVGAGGRELLFQVGPKNSWIARAYAKHAPHPYGGFIGQDIFQSGIIPGETDFQIYRDHGGKHIDDIDFLPGLDFAAIHNGHVYHTALDDVAYVVPGVMQHTGENLLGLVKGLTEKGMMTDEELGGDDEEVVFHDVFGMWMVIYSRTTSITLRACGLLVFPICVLAARTSLRAVYRGFVVALTTVGASVLVSLLLAGCLTASGLILRWYSHPFRLFTMYLLVVATTCLVVRDRFDDTIAGNHPHLDERATHEQNAFLGSVSVWALVLLVFVKGVPTVDHAMYWVLFPALFRLLSILSQPKTKHAAPTQITWSFSIIYAIGLIVPAIFCVQDVYPVVLVFFPLLARIGDFIPPDLVAAVLLSFLFAILLLVPLSLVHLLSRAQRTQLIRICVAISFVSIVFTSYTFPFKADYPQRMYLVQVSREFHSCDNAEVQKDAGIAIFQADYLGLSVHSPELRDLKPLDCRNKMMCDLPWYFPLDFAIHSPRFVPLPFVDALAPHNELAVRVTDDSTMVVRSKHLRRISFEVTGTTHMSVLIPAPKPNTLSLVDWSFGREAMEDGEHKEVFETPVVPMYRALCDCYFVFRATGNATIPWRFWLTFDDKRPTSERGDRALQLRFSGHVLESSPELKEFEAKLPNWLSPVSIRSGWKKMCF